MWIAEGRDLGTAVFPEAELKFFMVADADTRAERRFKELKERGAEVTEAEVKQNILERDRKDSQRKNDPLQKADDAIEIDTTQKNRHLPFKTFREVNSETRSTYVKMVLGKFD
jgi:cytidylate kinase